jgi:hypothetical protein
MWLCLIIKTCSGLSVVLLQILCFVDEYATDSHHHNGNLPLVALLMLAYKCFVTLHSFAGSLTMVNDIYHLQHQGKEISR